MLEEETGNPLLQRLWTAAPMPLDELLRLGGEMVHEIQAEHKEVLGKTDHLLLVERQEISIRQRIEIVGVTLVIAEDALLLEDIGR